MVAVNLRIHQPWSVREVLYGVTDGSSLVGGWVVAVRMCEIGSIDRGLLAAACPIILYYLSRETSSLLGPDLE